MRIVPMQWLLTKIVKVQVASLKRTKSSMITYQKCCALKPIDLIVNALVSPSMVVGGYARKYFSHTLGGGELFRGETILFLHKSEIAFWEDKTGTLKKSLNATVPFSPFTAIIEETTANGYNEFKDSWDRSVRG